MPLSQGFLSTSSVENCSMSKNYSPKILGQTNVIDPNVTFWKSLVPNTIFSKLPGMTKLARKPKGRNLGNRPRSWVSSYSIQTNSAFKIPLRLLLHDQNAFHSAWPQIMVQEIYCITMQAYYYLFAVGKFNPW